MSELITDRIKEIQTERSKETLFFCKLHDLAISLEAPNLDRDVILKEFRAHTIYTADSSGQSAINLVSY